MSPASNQERPRRRASSLAERHSGDKSHGPLETATHKHRARDGEGAGDALPRRTSSLRERYPGDMSHRPLAVLTREHRAADRAPRLRTHRHPPPSDAIDSLDSTGPVPGATYHHGGPFDATLKAYNANSRYAPVDAVRDTNMEALKATPAEFVQDSLVKHVPLQGTAVVPPGFRDWNGRLMEYEEGADLMREADAEGGPYKRWEHVHYRDDDLKGKGEPAFSIDKDRRERRKQEAAANPSSPGGTVCNELQPNVASLDVPGSRSSRFKEGHGAHVRQRSASNGDQPLKEPVAGSSGLQRSNTAGKSIAQSLKRRFGSLRGKKESVEAGC
ncbi:hypothetical protein VTK26DRAFT_3137 [Humicola hyalothermophila]